MVKKIRINAKIIVAYQSGEHRILHDGCVIVEGSQIIFVGKTFDEPVDEVIELNAGEVDRLGIKQGDKLNVEYFTK